MKKDFTILVQGPLNSRSIDKLDYYSRFAEIIVSGWTNDKPELIQEVCKKGYRLILNEYHVPTCCNSHNGYYQFFNTVNALKTINTPYAIKLRSDEYIDNIPYLIQSVLDNPEKLTTVNFIMVPDSKKKYHPSDHILAGDSIYLTWTFLDCLEVAQKSPTLTKYDISTIMDCTRDVSIEQLIFLCWLYQMPSLIDSQILEFNDENSKELTKKHLNIIDMDNLKPFHFRINQLDWDVEDKRQVLHIEPQLISSIEEL